MSNTYLFALTDGGGTLAPEVGVARRLVERGHHVVILGEDSMAAAVAGAGAALSRGATGSTGPTTHASTPPPPSGSCAPLRRW